MKIRMCYLCLKKAKDKQLVCQYCYGYTLEMEVSDLLKEMELLKAKKRRLINEIWADLPDNEEYV